MITRKQQPPFYYFGSRSLRLKIPFMEGNDVAVLQSLLNLLPEQMVDVPLPVDGVFAQQTRKAVKQFQRYFHLRSRGVVDQDTYYRLGHRTGSYTYHEPVFSSRLLGMGSRGPDVTVLQNRLAAFRKPYLNRPASGCFDRLTEQALRMFQSQFAELQPDGMAGPKTFDMLLRWSPLGGRTLQKGRHGLDAYLLQLCLYHIGFFTRTPDGFFDQRTQKALLEFQGQAALTRDGLAGPQSYLALGTVLPFPSHCYYYQVKQGDSVTQVARLFNKNPEDLIKLNRLAGPDFAVRPGSLLKMPPPLTFHVAEKGDTLESLAKYYAVPLTDLRISNHLLPLTSLLPGEMVVLPKRRQDYEGSVLYIENHPQGQNLRELALPDLHHRSLLELGPQSRSRLYITTNHRKLALLNESSAELSIYDRDTGISRSLNLPSPAGYLAWAPRNNKLVIGETLVITPNDPYPRFQMGGRLAQWLPDNETLVYLQGSRQIRKVHTGTGSGRDLLTLPDESIHHMQLDPAGRRLLVVAELTPERVFLTYILDLVTGELKEFSRNDHASAWSSDGEFLLLTGKEYYGDYYPWFYQIVRCFFSQNLLLRDQITAKEIIISPHCFSGDNRYYLLLMGVPGNFYALRQPPRDLFVKHAGSRLITQLTCGQDIQDPVWLRD